MDLDLATLGIFLLSFAVCAALVAAVSLFGAKEKTFEEALEEQKRKRETEKGGKKGGGQSAKEKKKMTNSGKKKAAAETKVQTEEISPSATTATIHEGVKEGGSKKQRKKQRKKSESSSATVAAVEAFPEAFSSNFHHVADPQVVVETHAADGGHHHAKTNKVLEVHRQYLQDDFVEDEVNPIGPPTPEIISTKEHLNLIQETVPEEATPRSTPRSTPEPTPAPLLQKKRNNKKNKIHIEEVNEAPPTLEVEVEKFVEKEVLLTSSSVAAVVEVFQLETENIVHKASSPLQGDKAAKKGKKGKGVSEGAHETGDKPAAPSAKLGARDLITMVKKTPFDDSEAQQLIDILLNKQAGGTNAGGDWVDTGKGQQNEIKVLQKNLSDKISELDEERARTKSITDRMNLLRSELNQSKSHAVGTQRVLDDIQGRHQQELAGLQSRLQQEMEQHARDVNHLQSQINFQLTHAQNLQVSIDQMQLQMAQHAHQPQVDPNIFAELDALRATNVSLDLDISTLREKLAKTKDASELEAKRLTEMDKKCEGVSVELSKAQKENKTLEERCRKSSTDGSHMKEKVDELSRGKKELEAKVTEMTTRVHKLESESGRLAEENERLAEQLAANVERPVAEGQESSKQNGGVENGNNHAAQLVMLEKERLQQQAGEDEGAKWMKKYQIISQEKEEIVKQNDVVISKLQTEVGNYQTQIKQVQTELESQRAKNDEATGALGKSKRDSELAHQALLERLFPEIHPSSPKGQKDHEAWLQDFAGQIRVRLDDAEAKVKLAEAKVKEATGAKEAGDAAASVEQLEKQVAHYKTVLAQTESMLNKLQSSVETEEREWKERLSQKDSELERLRGEKEELGKKNLALNESLKVVKQAEEMQEKLQELQSKLSEEETEKKEIFKKYTEVEKQLGERQSLQEEVSSLRAQLTSEKSKSSTLGDKVVKLGQAVATGQEALQQEQKTVELLSDGASPGSKGSDDVSENGPKSEPELPKTPKSVASSSSQVGSLASLDSSDSNTPSKKVSKKKKLLGLFK